LNIITKNIELNTKGNTDIIDITSDISKILNDSALKTGMINIFIPGSTGSITTIEFEPGVVEDLKNIVNELIPLNKVYKHNLAWGDGNGHSHVRSAILGPSLTIQFENTELVLGTWQQIVFIDFDNRKRHRIIKVQLIGN